MSGSGRARSEWFAPPLPRLLAHRGLALEHVENTIPAFRAAVDAGATYVECDVHASSDGVAIVAHDPDLTRLGGVGTRVEDLTADELAGIDLGGGAGFPSLADVLRAFPGIRFNIDVKSGAAAGPAATAILSAGAGDRVLLTSFSGVRRRAALDAVRRGGGPVPATSASARTFAMALLAGTLGIAPLVRWLLRDVDAVQVPERALGLRVPTPRMLAIIHSAGVEMHVWTINDTATMARLLAAGVDGIITDRIDLARALVDATNRNRA